MVRTRHYQGKKLSEEDDSLRPFEDAVAILVVFTTGLKDHHRDAFDLALADLLRLARGKASAQAYVRRIVADKLNCPHDPQWRVSAAEFERRGQQVFLGLSAQTQEVILAAISTTTS